MSMKDIEDDRRFSQLLSRQNFCKMLFRGILMKVVGETEGSEDKFWVLKNSSSKMVSCEGDQGRTKQKPVSNIFGHFDLVCCLILHIAFLRLFFDYHYKSSQLSRYFFFAVSQSRINLKESDTITFI